MRHQRALEFNLERRLAGQKAGLQQMTEDPKSNGIEAISFDPVDVPKRAFLARRFDLFCGQKKRSSLLVDNAELDDYTLDVVA